MALQLSAALCKVEAFAGGPCKLCKTELGKFSHSAVALFGVEPSFDMSKKGGDAASR